MCAVKEKGSKTDPFTRKWYNRPNYVDTVILTIQYCVSKFSVSILCDHFRVLFTVWFTSFLLELLADYFISISSRSAWCEIPVGPCHLCFFLGGDGINEISINGVKLYGFDHSDLFHLLSEVLVYFIRSVQYENTPSCVRFEIKLITCKCNLSLKNSIILVQL